MRELNGYFVRIVLSVLSKAATGGLNLVLPDKTVHNFGPESLGAKIIVRDWNFFRRIVLDADIGFGESFMTGEWESPDVTQVIRFFIENMENLGGGVPGSAWIGKWINRLRHLMRINTLSGSKRNIAAHYDLSNDFFQTFLDPTMMYSCALFERADESLEAAQKRKIHSIIRKARIGPDDHVLEIGFGWGAFAIEAVKQTGCRLTGITLSERQFQLATERVLAEGLQDRIEFRICDYRKMKGHFDKIVSIEMLEAVGHEYLGAYFKACDRLLKPNGLLVLQVITIPDHRYQKYRRSCDWIQKHIFPGALLPSLSALSAAMTSHSRFMVEHLENIGVQYANTLRHWKGNLKRSAGYLATLGFDEEVQRTWEYYFSYCEAGFATRTINDVQLVLTRPSNKSLPGTASA